MKTKEFYKVFIVLFVIIILIVVFSSCTKTLATQNDKIKIVATIFPQYDFARQITNGNAEIMLLLVPGIESHTYEPTPLDMKKINDSDIFIYTGDQMEPWARRIIESIDNESLIVVDASNNATIIEEFDDNHEQVQHESDPHIWLDPTNAMIMVDNITQVIIKKDVVNKEFYQKNAVEYKNKLLKLDEDFKAATSKDSNTIVFAGRFAYAYFVDSYDISYISAYESCSTHDEPSVNKIIEVIEFIKENNIKVVYHEELTDPKIAKSIAEQTDVNLAVLHTLHNISSSDMKDGKTYIDIMYENLQNLKMGINK